MTQHTPKHLYNTVVGVQSINLVSYTTVLYPNKNIDYIEKWPWWSFFYIIFTFLGSIIEPCCIQNCVITNSVIKRLMCINPKYWNTLVFYQKHPKLWTNSFNYLLMDLKYCWMRSKQSRAWSHTILWGIWSGFTLFAQAFLFQYIILLWYFQNYNGTFKITSWKGIYPCLFVWFGLNVAFNLFQSYRDGVWMWQGAQCSLLECCLTEISRPRHFDMIFHPVTLYWHWADQF